MGRICVTETTMAGCGAAGRGRERDKAEIKSDEKVQEWEGSHWHEGLICCKGGEREGRYTVRLKRCWIQGDKWWTLEAGAWRGRLDERKEEWDKESNEGRNGDAFTLKLNHSKMLHFSHFFRRVCILQSNIELYNQWDPASRLLCPWSALLLLSLSVSMWHRLIGRCVRLHDMGYHGWHILFYSNFRLHFQQLARNDKCKCKIQIRVTGNVFTSTKEFMFVVAFAHHFVCKHETFWMNSGKML